MKTTVEKGNIIIFLAGRIDTTNAPQVEQEITDAVSAHSEETPVFDVTDLQYISSVGLRILMKCCKKAGKKLRVLNASKEVYDIFETTGFTNILDVSKALRQISVEGCEMIGSGGYGKVYRIDPETIAKIYTPGMSLEEVQKERDTAQKAFLLGIPTAISYDVVKNDDCYGVVFELLNAKTVAQCMDADPSCVKKMGVGSAKLLRELHQISVEDKTFPERKQEMLDWVEKIVPVLDASEIEEIRSFIQSVPDSKNFLHGDFNSKNIMVNGDEFLLIDIGDAAIGHAVFDVAGLVLPYRRLINSKLPLEERKRLLGFRLEDANLLLHTLIATYFGIDSDDAEQIEKRIQTLMPYASLLASYHGTRRVGFNVEYMKTTTLPLMRQMLLPAIRDAQPLDW